MTEEEQDQIVGKFVRSLSVATKRLACLEIKAYRLGGDIALLARFLRRETELSHDFNPNDWPTGQEIADMLSSMDATKAEIDTLMAQKERLRV